MKRRARAVSYFFSLLVIAAIFFSVEHFAEKLFFKDYDLADIISAIAAAISFSECRRFFDRATDRIFSRGPRDARVEFITNISHELQTPIAILRGNIEFLQRENITEGERTIAERVIVSTLDEMSCLIASVLESAKIRFSKKSFHAGAVDMVSLVREVCEDCALLAEDKGIRLSSEVLAATKGGSAYIVVRGDRCKLREVLLNLISNALKHTARCGFIAVRAERIEASARITVVDSGCGIAPEELPYIFERFYRIGKDAAPGTGIGLSICREVIEAHGGTIAATSEPGKGSRFIVSLPLVSPAHNPVRSPASAFINS